jgi:hypothetical protein
VGERGKSETGSGTGVRGHSDSSYSLNRAAERLSENDSGRELSFASLAVSQPAALAKGARRSLRSPNLALSPASTSPSPSRLPPSSSSSSPPRFSVLTQHPTLDAGQVPQPYSEPIETLWHERCLGNRGAPLFFLPFSFFDLAHPSSALSSHLETDLHCL